MSDIYEHQREVEMHRLAAAVEWQDREIELSRISMILKPHLSIDGNQWCALYGENLQDGVAGFGDSPDAAMRAFDEVWAAPLGASNDD